MNTIRNTIVFAYLLGWSAVQADPPELRHLNYLALFPQRGDEIHLDVRSIPYGKQSSEDRLKWRFVEPAGYAASEGEAVFGTNPSVRLPVTWDGKCALEINGGTGNRAPGLSQLTFQSDTIHAYLSGLGRPLTTVRAWGPLYFFVPKDTKYFNVWIQASVTREGLHFAIRDPKGELVREEDGDFDERTKVQILLPKGKSLDGQAWSLEISRPTNPGLHLDDVSVELGRHLPPFLAPKPEWAEVMGRDWKYEEGAASAKTRFDPTEPKEEPFAGIHNKEIDAAYYRDVSKGWKTTLPFTYVLDYGPRHVSNPDRILTIQDREKVPQIQGDSEYVNRVGTAPPSLLHLGKDVALNHGWGPVKSLGGENEAYGRGDFVTRLTPDQVKDRIATMRELAGDLREAGVRWVIPYICAMTINGNHEKRSGFWEFYDHWDEYRSLGLGPRPASDPFTWLQRNPDGSPRMYYRYTGDHYPSFDVPNHRYAASWHAKGFREWMREVVRFLAKCDFDGCFVDNGTSQRGIGPLALVEFKQHLEKTIGKEKARDWFGVEDIEKVEFPTKAGTPLFVEMNRFWCETIRDQMAFIKEVGTRELGREFVVFPNGGRPGYIQSALMDTDFVMFEKSHGEYGSHPGLVFAPIFDEVKLRAYNDNIFEHKYVQSLRQRVKPVILSREGYPTRLPWAMLNPNAAELGFAESAAFSGGGGFLLRPDFDLYHDALNKYRRFFETHPKLYAGLDTYASVGLLAWAEQEWYGNDTHLVAVQQITDALGEAHVLFDYVPESQTTLSMLHRYDAVVAPEVHYLSDTQQETIQEYVKGGGRLITMGEFATHNHLMKERPADVIEPGSRVECKGPEEVIAAIGPGFSAAVVAGSPEERHVKINVFAGDQRIVVHVVNYNVPLGIEVQPVVEIQGFQLEIPLKPGQRCLKAVSHTPDHPEPVELTMRTLGDKVQMTLPSLRIYQVVELSLSE